MSLTVAFPDPGLCILLDSDCHIETLEKGLHVVAVTHSTLSFQVVPFDDKPGPTLLRDQAR